LQTIFVVFENFFDYAHVVKRLDTSNCPVKPITLKLNYKADDQEDVAERAFRKSGPYPGQPFDIENRESQSHTL